MRCGTSRLRDSLSGFVVLYLRESCRRNSTLDSLLIVVTRLCALGIIVTLNVNGSLHFTKGFSTLIHEISLLRINCANLVSVLRGCTTLQMEPWLEVGMD